MIDFHQINATGVRKSERLSNYTWIDALRRVFFGVCTFIIFMLQRGTPTAIEEKHAPLAKKPHFSRDHNFLKEFDTGLAQEYLHEIKLKSSERFQRRNFQRFQAIKGK